MPSDYCYPRGSTCRAARRWCGRWRRPALLRHGCLEHQYGFLAKFYFMRNSLFARLLLISALLIVQLGSLTHGISHVLAEQSQGSEQSLPHDKYCDQCAAYAQIGGAIGSSGISFASSENFETPH